MPELTIQYTQDALKDMRGIGQVTAGKVRDKIMAYVTNPNAFASQVKKLQGQNALRLRVGDYRVLFTKEGIILNVLHVGHRREIYR